MRGTLHLLPATEFPLWQAALSSRRHYLRPSWSRYFGVTPEQLEQLLAAVAEALDGRLLTRKELADEVARLTGSAHLREQLQSSWGALLKPAAFRGDLCFAPSSGQNVRFTRPASWLGCREQVDPEQALAEVTRHFLSTYGPATREQFGRWWGLEPAPALARIRALGEEVAEVGVDGGRAWTLAAHLPALAEAAPAGSVRLLPAFDQYVVCAPRDSSVLAAAFRGRVYRPQGWLSPVLLVEPKGSRIEVRIEPFERVPAAIRRAAEAEAERLAAFLGGKADVSWARG
jgi:hypothetical protein